MEWVSVKERLPEPNQEVLFVNGKNEVSCGVRMPVNETENEWASENSIYFNDSIALEWCTCKFWMLLPRPPKEE